MMYKTILLTKITEVTAKNIYWNLLTQLLHITWATMESPFIIVHALWNALPTSL
jgi:hypothetical protein